MFRCFFVMIEGPGIACQARPRLTLDATEARGRRSTAGCCRSGCSPASKVEKLLESSPRETIARDTDHRSVCCGGNRHRQAGSADGSGGRHGGDRELHAAGQPGSPARRSLLAISVASSRAALLLCPRAVLRRRRRADRRAECGRPGDQRDRARARRDDCRNERRPSSPPRLAATSAVYVLRVSDLLTSAWNPHIVVLPTMVAVIARAAAAAGRVWLLLLAALVASAVAQTDVGVLPVAVLLGGASLAWMSIAGGRDNSFRRVRSVAGATALVVGVVWLLPVIEQDTGAPGTLTSLRSLFVRGAAAGQPLRVAFAAWSGMLSGPGIRPDVYLAHGWMLQRSHNPWAQAWAISQMAVLALSVAVSFRAGRRSGAVSIRVPARRLTRRVVVHHADRR